MESKDSVWIDREEYNRLKSFEAQSWQNTATIAHATQAGMDAGVHDQKFGILTILTGGSAIISFLFPPAVLLFLILGIISLIRWLRHGRASSATKSVVGGLSIIVGIIGLVMFGPYLLFFAFILMWQIGCWTGLGTCTTA